MSDAYFAAITNNDSTRVIELLRNGVVTVGTRQPNGEQWTGLHLAAELGHLNILNHLLSAGADIDARKLVHLVMLFIVLAGMVTYNA
jgi:ankyrin repeat protein